MAHRQPIITQPDIARALREAKKQGYARVEMNPANGNIVFYVHESKPAINAPTSFIDEWFAQAEEQEVRLTSEQEQALNNL